jgi:hypothetical protein
VFLGGSLIALKTKKQTVVSRSTTEAELRAMASLTAEVIWLRWLLEDFGVSVTTPTSLLSNSTGAISIVRDPVKHELTKHIGFDAFFVCTAVQDQILALGYVPSELQLAVFSRRPRPKRSIASFSPNSVLLIHHEFEGGGVLDMYSLPFVFPSSIRGSLYITHTCTCIGLWPPVNDSCHSQYL